jgi:prevent-host-death family protein
MKHKLSPADVRQRLGDILDRCATKGEEFVVERKGAPAAAIVPAYRLEQMRELARSQVRAYMDARRGKSDLTQRQADGLAREAVRWARTEARKEAVGKLEKRRGRKLTRKERADLAHLSVEKIEALAAIESPAKK